MEIKRGDTVTAKDRTGEFEVLGIRDGTAYITNDEILNNSTPETGVYEELGNLTKVN